MNEQTIIVNALNCELWNGLHYLKFIFSLNGESLILSCSGSYGDDEAVLKWRKHQNEVNYHSDHKFLDNLRNVKTCLWC